MSIADSFLQESKGIIISGIFRKLAAARKVMNFDKEVAAGLYVYAVEELGKLEVLRNVQDGILKYSSEFRNHGLKFKKAKEYFEKVGYPECYYLHEGAFSSVSFSSDSFDVDTEADTSTRLGVFYTDISYDKGNYHVTGIITVPVVDESALNSCINKFEEILKNWA